MGRIDSQASLLENDTIPDAMKAKHAPGHSSVPASTAGASRRSTTNGRTSPCLRNVDLAAHGRKGDETHVPRSIVVLSHGPTADAAGDLEGPRLNPRAGGTLGSPARYPRPHRALLAPCHAAEAHRHRRGPGHVCRNVSAWTPRPRGPRFRPGAPEGGRRTSVPCASAPARRHNPGPRAHDQHPSTRTIEVIAARRDSVRSVIPLPDTGV